MNYPLLKVRKVNKVATNGLYFKIGDAA